MASSQDVLKAIETLRVAYPHAKISNPAALMDLWCKKFADASPRALEMAADACIDTYEFFPSVAQMHKALDKMEIEASALDAQEQERQWWANFRGLSAEWDELRAAYYQGGEFDPAEWRGFIGRAQAAGREALANEVRCCLEQIQVAV